MTVGAGKYDHVCTLARERAGALAAVVIILGGRHGNGFSVQSVQSAQDSVMKSLPSLLRNMANQIEADLSAE